MKMNNPEVKVKATVVYVRTQEIDLHPVVELFPMLNNNYQDILTSIKNCGFSEEHPLLLLPPDKGGKRLLCMDGQSRLTAALELGLPSVPAVVRGHMYAIDIMYELRRLHPSRKYEFYVLG